MSDKIQTELELSDKQNDAKSDVAEKITIWGKVKQLLSNVTVEPFLLCYLIPLVISSIAVQKFNLVKACRVDLGFSEEICDNVLNGNVSDNITSEASDGAQKLIADMYAWAQPLQLGMTAFIILFVGAWSDKTGNRKVLMLIPIVGEIVSSLGLILATYFLLEWPLWITALIEALPSAFSGSFPVALMASASYIADVTTVESRTFRMGVVTLIVTMGFPLGTSFGGYLTEAVGFFGVFIIVIALFSFGFLHTYININDVRQQPLQGTFLSKLAQFFNFKIFLSFLSLFKGKKLFRVILVSFSYIFILGPIFGEAPLAYLYALKKFGMTYADYSLFTTYTLLVGLAGTTILVTVFSKYFKLHDAFLGVIVTCSKISANVCYGLAPSKTWYFLGPVFDIFGSAGGLVAKSMGTKVVQDDEIGKMCSLLGFVESIVPVIYTPLYAKAYSNTLSTMPGFFYILGAIMTVPALIAFVTLYIMLRKEEKDVVKNPEAKEVHAHENSVTVL